MNRKIILELLEEIKKIDNALATKQITAESADLLRKQAAAQAERAAAASRSARPTTRVAGMNVPEGGKRARALLTGTGLAGAGLAGASAILDRLPDSTKPTDPKSSYTPSIRTQADIRQDVANRNFARELGNIFVVEPIRFLQGILNALPTQDIPLKEYYEIWTSCSRRSKG
jgi:hypothetical protein